MSTNALWGLRGHWKIGRSLELVHVVGLYCIIFALALMLHKWAE